MITIWIMITIRKTIKMPGNNMTLAIVIREETMADLPLLE